MRPSYWPDWWSPEICRQSQEHFELMHRSSCCDAVLDDWLDYKMCPKCRTGYSPVPDYERLEREFVLDALAGND